MIVGAEGCSGYVSPTLLNISGPLPMQLLDGRRVYYQMIEGRAHTHPYVDE